MAPHFEPKPLTGELTIRPLGVGWERLDQKPRMPRAVALFWPLLPASLFLVGINLLGQLWVGLFLTALWLGATLPLTAHPRLLRRIEISGGVLTYRGWLGRRTHIPLQELDRAVICQLSQGIVYMPYTVPVGALGGGAPHFYLLDHRGRLRLRLRLVRYSPEQLELLFSALPVRVQREGSLLSSSFEQRYPRVLRRYRLQNQSPMGLVVSCCLGGPVVLLVLILVSSLVVVLLWAVISALLVHHG